MKKSILFVVFVLCIFNLQSQNWMEFITLESITPNYNILQSNDTIVRFTVTIPGMFETPVDTFNRVNIKEHTKMDSVGYPEMPIVSFLVAIPQCDSVNLNIFIIDSTQFTGYNIYPAPELVPDTTAGGAIALIEQFAYNRTAYETDAMFPGYIGETIDKGAIRDQHLVRVVLYPVQFNPVKDFIKAYSDFQITLTFNNPSGLINNDVGIFNEVVGNTLINYQSNGLNASVNCGAGLENSGSIYWINELPNNKVDSTCDYLIITPRNFYIDTVARNKIEELAQHRADFNGFDVAIVRTSTIDTFINVLPDMFLYEKIQYLIKETYESNNANHTYDGKLAYVNLFGDVELQDGSPGIPTYSEGYDVYFTQLTWYLNNQGDTIYDDYPDLMIGRCSVDTVTQVENVVHKILHFKPDTLAWKDDMVMVICHDITHYPFYSEVLLTMEEIINNTFDITFIKPPDFNYPFPQWDTTQYFNNAALLSAWDSGQMFINYLGHGNETGWLFEYTSFNYTLLDSSQNNILPLIFSNSCSTGAFHSQDNEDCMAEEFLCSDPDKGSIAFIGSPIATALANAKMVPIFYNAVLNEHLYITGEALMETQLNNTIFSPDDFNLIGDPAINIFYENIDTLKPDLVVRKSEISFQPDQNNIGDTVLVTAIIRNNSIIDIENSFYVACYFGDPEVAGSIAIDSIQVDSLSGFVADTLSFTWKTAGFDPGYHDIYLCLDMYDSIDELSENNNANHKQIVLTGYYNGFPANVSINSNSYPVAFDINDNYSHEELIMGENILSCGGEIITSYSQNSKSYTSIGNLNNDEEYQVVLIQTGSTDSLKCFNDEFLWTYPLTNLNHGPAIADINNDGLEEVVFSNTYLDANYNSCMKLICLNSDGTVRWICEDFDSIPYQGSGEPSVTQGFIPLIGASSDYSSKIIYLTRAEGKLFLIREIAPDSIQVTNAISIDNFSRVLKPPIASDIDKDGFINILFYGRDTLSNKKLCLFNTNSLNIEYNYTLNGNNYSSPVIADINNDGLPEIIIVECNSGILIFNNELDSIGFISEPDIILINLASADFDNDFNNDIICNVLANSDEKIIRIYNAGGNSIFEVPINFSNPEFWLSDIDTDQDIEIICGKNNVIGLVDVPNAGSSIGWPGQQGNVRNTGVLEHPAYFAPSGDTVYWMNTISLAGDSEIPEGSTVIIKPGTKIKAHAGSSLDVHGILIAEGTENHPITFTADINGADAGYWQGITVPNHSAVSMKHCLITDAEIGILFQDYNEVTFTNCWLENNMEGIGAKTSSPVLKENIITGNNIGLGCYDNASPVLSDLEYEKPYRNGIINNNTGILIDKSNIYLDCGCNDIYSQLPTEDYFISLMFEFEPGPGYIKARNNYWGTTDLEEIYEHLDPLESFIIEPILTSPQSSYVPPEGQEIEMMKSANNAMDNGDYPAAENTYKAIIQQYPETTEAYLSISGLFECYYKSSGNWNNLETYYNGLYNDTVLNNDFQKLAFGYINLCKRQAGDFSGAIANYEFILLNDPTYNDSVYAVIDIGNTYEEAGNYKSTLGQLSYLVPVSRAKHVEKTVDLLLSLKSEKLKQNISNNSQFILEGVYPNPFKNETTVIYHVPVVSNISVRVVDAIGKTIFAKNEGVINEGKHQLVLKTPDITPGMYFIILESGGRAFGMKKLVVK